MYLQETIKALKKREYFYYRQLVKAFVRMSNCFDITGLIIFL